MTTSKGHPQLGMTYLEIIIYEQKITTILNKSKQTQIRSGASPTSHPEEAGHLPAGKTAGA
jgi:hypothetical protein